MLRLLKKIPIHPTFLLLLAWFVSVGGVGEFLIYMLVVLIHELGHYLVAKKRGYRMSGFYLAPYGVALNYKEGKFLARDEISIALAGPLANILSGIALVSLWWFIPESYIFTQTFVSYSFFLALFNLLPAYPLDGGRVLVSALSDKISRKKALKITIVINIVLSILFFAGFVITCFVNYNPFLALMVVFLLGGVMETKFEGKYMQIDVFNKRIKDFSQIKCLAVNDSVTLSALMKAIDSGKLTIFYVMFQDGRIKVLTEKMVLSLCMKHPLSSKISELPLK